MEVSWDGVRLSFGEDYTLTNYTNNISVATATFDVLQSYFVEKSLELSWYVDEPGKNCISGIGGLTIRLVKNTPLPCLF